MRKIQNQKPVKKKITQKQLSLPVNKNLLLRRTATKKKQVVESVAPGKKFNKQKFLERQMMQSQMTNNSSSLCQVIVITIYFVTIYTIWVIDKVQDQLLTQSPVPNTLNDYKKYKFYLLYTEIGILVVFIYEIMQRFKNTFMKTAEKNDLRAQSFLLLVYLAVIALDTQTPTETSLGYKLFKLLLVILRIIFFLRKLETVGKYRKETKQLKFKLNIDKVLYIQTQVLQILKDKKIKLQLDTNIKMIKHNKLLNIFVKEESQKEKEKEKDMLTLIPIQRGKRRQNTQVELGTSSTLEPNKWRGSNNPPVVLTTMIEIPSRCLVYIEVNWDRLTFSPFMLEHISDSMGLYYFLLYQLTRRSFVHSLRLEEDKCEALAQVITANYFSSNPYHNATHALDVLQTSMAFVYGCQFLQLARLNQLDQLALVLSTAAHDLAHPGVNSLFLTNALHPMAITYSNRAVLENYHCAHFFSFYYKSEYNVTGHLSSQDQQYFRTVFIKCVLATDMGRHFLDLENLKNRLDSSDLNMCQSDKQTCLNALVHAADISNPLKSTQVYTQWVALVMEEFFLQGDRETSLGLPISPQCDRASVSVAQSQVGFITVIIWPLYQQVLRFLPLLEPHLNQITYNSQYYQYRLQKEKDENEKETSLIDSPKQT